MPRANRYFLPGHVWHITHRCHQKEFLLKFRRDRRRWQYWLYEARKRFGLCVLNYIVTSNHIHLLVQDTGNHVIPKSMQLIAGRVAQEYNQRKKRKGAFWEDRYHATAIDTEQYFMRCLLYIDLNMVRAGVVSHTSEWAESGYHEIQNTPDRYRTINTAALLLIAGFSDLDHFRREYRKLLNTELTQAIQPTRDSAWSECLAVGSQQYVEQLKNDLGSRATACSINKIDKAHLIQETPLAYSANFPIENAPLKENNTYIWDETDFISMT